MRMRLRMLPHTVIVLTPVPGTDAYDNETLDYAAGTSSEVRAFVQPKPGSETTDARDAVVTELVMFHNDPVSATDRITWAGNTYEVTGPPRAWDTPSRGLHYETNLRRVIG